jgi:transposase-like protein
MRYERKVTPENKAKALDLLRQSMTTAEIAKTVGIDESTIYFWIASDDDFSSAWKPQIVANHLRLVSENIQEAKDFNKRIDSYLQKEDASMAPLLAIKAKMFNQTHLSSMGVLGKIAKGWADNQNLNNNLSGSVEGKISIINLEGVKPDATSND